MPAHNAAWSTSSPNLPHSSIEEAEHIVEDHRLMTTGRREADDALKGSRAPSWWRGRSFRRWRGTSRHTSACAISDFAPIKRPRRWPAMRALGETSAAWAKRPRPSPHTRSSRTELENLSYHHEVGKFIAMESHYRPDWWRTALSRSTLPGERATRL